MGQRQHSRRGEGRGVHQQLEQSLVLKGELLGPGGRLTKLGFNRFKGASSLISGPRALSNQVGVSFLLTASRFTWAGGRRRRPPSIPISLSRPLNVSLSVQERRLVARKRGEANA